MAAQVLSELFASTAESVPLTFSEDCLYLNVYTPADLMKTSRLPVRESASTAGSLGRPEEEGISGWGRHNRGYFWGSGLPLSTTARPFDHRKHPFSDLNFP